MLAIPFALQSKFEERLRNESIPNKLLAVNHPTYVGVSRACLSCYGKMVFDCGDRPSFNYSQNVR